MPLSFEVERILKMRQEFKEQCTRKQEQNEACSQKTQDELKKISELIKKFRD